MLTAQVLSVQSLSGSFGLPPSIAALRESLAVSFSFIKGTRRKQQTEPSKQRIET